MNYLQMSRELGCTPDQARHQVESALTKAAAIARSLDFEVEDFLLMIQSVEELDYPLHLIDFDT